MADKKFDELVTDASSCLSIKDKQYLEKDYQTQQKLKSFFEKLSKESPGELIKDERIGLTIPAQEQSFIDVSSRNKPGIITEESFLRISSDDNDKIGKLLKEFPACPETMVESHHLTKEVAWGAFVSSLGDLTKLVNHCLTPKQIESMLEKTRPLYREKQYELILFMEGLCKSPDQLQALPGDNFRAVHVLRFFFGEMKKDRIEKLHERFVDWRLIGYIYPIDQIDSFPVMMASGAYNDSVFDQKSIILLKK